MISDDEGIRYHRQLLIDQWGVEGQEKLKRSRVTMIGAGGLGSPAALYLVAAGVGRLRIVDRDRVELSNLNRQILHGEGSLARPKVASAGDRLKDLNSSIQLELMEMELSEESAPHLCADTDILVDCLDSFSARRVLNRQAVQNKIPLVHAGISGGGGQITVIPPGGGPCLECLFPQAPDGKEIPVVGAAAGIIGSMEALEVIKLITGIGDTLTGRLLICNGFAADYQEIAVQADPDCPVCGGSS